MAAVVAGAFAVSSGPAAASDRRPVAGDVPLSVPGEGEAQLTGPAPDPEAAQAEQKSVPKTIPTKIDPATQEVVAVAVGLGPQAPGSRPERALVDRLEAGVSASTHPKATVRRFRDGTGTARQICRQNQVDLVIAVDYLPDRPLPTLLTHDCRLDRALGVRAGEAAGDPQLVGVLWDEHRQLVRDGVKERRAMKLNPKVRTGLLAGGAIVVLGTAIGVLIANGLRKDTVVLTVGP